MPDSLHPPYNITQPRQLQRWLDVNAQNGSLKRTSGFFLLPPFNIPFVPPSVNPNFQYSDIVGVFNFTSSNNFSIKNYAHLTNDGSYTLCIAYQQTNSLSMVRYRLIDGAAIPIGFTKYAGQQILKNFRLEIWSTGNTCLNVTSIQFNTTVLGTQDYRYGLDFAIGNASVICQSQNNINAALPLQPPQANLRIWFTWDSGIVLGAGNQVASWTDRTAYTVIAQATAGLRPTLGSSYIQFLGQSSLGGALGLSNIVYYAFLVTVNVGTINSQVIATVTGGHNVFLYDGDGASNTVVNTNFDGSFKTISYQVGSAIGSTVLVIMDTSTLALKCWDALLDILCDSQLQLTAPFTDAPNSLIIGGGPSAVAKGFDMRAMVGYTQTPSAADIVTLQTYMFSLVPSSPDFSLPLAFAACTVPTPNI